MQPGEFRVQGPVFQDPGFATYFVLLGLVHLGVP